MADQLRYRYGFGQTVIHILPPGDLPGFNTRHATASICQAPRTIFWAKGLYADVARSARTCKKCLAIWRKATGTPVPAREKAAVVTRDVQRARLYSAESLALKAGRRFSSEAQALAYTKALLDSDWVAKRWGRIRVRTVKYTNGFGAYSHNGRSMITLGYGHHHERTLLHEIAHQIVHQAYPSPIQGHGPLFARVVLALVQHKLGVAQAQALVESYRVHRVKVASPTLLARPAARPTGWQRAIHEGRVPA